MDDAAGPDTDERSAGNVVAATSPLTPSQQTRNLLLFAVCTGLQYLAAPVGYVGVT